MDCKASRILAELDRLQVRPWQTRIVLEAGIDSLLN